MRIILILLMLTATAYAQTDPVLLILPKLETFVQKAMHQKKIPGLAVAVVSKGKIVYMKSFGVRTLGQEDLVNQKTLFQIGSVSKPLSSTLIAILNRDQEITLDHPIEIIPGATLRHVLSHTTGVPSAGFNALIEGGSPPSYTHQKIEETTGEEPGKEFAYHNVAYNLLATVIESHLGTSFESTLQAKLLQPLQMTHTSSTWESFISQENRASPHVLQKIKGKKGKTLRKAMKTAPYRKEYTNFPAAGGFSSNIHDMALFLSAILGARPDVISPQDLDEFIRPIIHTPDQWQRTQKHRDRITETRYGLGWRHMIFAGQPLVFHGGWIRGFCNTLAFLPEQQIGIVILQNAESSFSNNVAMQFFDWVLGLPSKKWIM